MLDFPSSPTTGQKYPASPVAGVPVYTYDGEKWTTIGGSVIGKTAVLTDGSQAMTAQLTLITPPVANTDAASKSYVDGGVAGAIAAANSANTNANNKVAKSGDTMTGALNIKVPGSTSLKLGGNSYSVFHLMDDSTYYYMPLMTNSGDPNGSWNSLRPLMINLSNGNVQMNHALNVNGAVYCGGTLTCYNDANFAHSTMIQGDGNIVMREVDYPGKPNAGPWIGVSDARTKNVLGPYAAGLAEIMALKPVNYTLKGNSSLSAPPALKEGEAAPTAPYPHAIGYPLAVEGKISIGLVAQEAETVMPEMVMRVTGWIDGEQVDDLRMYNANALTYALVNAVKELKARIEALEAA